VQPGGVHGGAHGNAGRERGGVSGGAIEDKRVGLGGDSGELRGGIVRTES